MPEKVIVEDKTNGVFVVTVECAIDFETYQDVKNAIKPLLVKTTRIIIVDMKGVEYISSVGIGVILKTKMFMESIGGKFIMIGLRPQVHTVFEIIKALPHMQVFASMEEADHYFMTIQRNEMEKNRKDQEK
ncbi:MAG: STAS domain-containing protein [Candidatus Omnitrophota bacterium]